MKNYNLEDRMKRYENVSRTYLTCRTPVIIRIDGKAFSTFTKDFDKPFDVMMVQTMQDTMQYLCENIEGCVLGYTQSDEITLVLCDYKKLTSQAWFNNNVQKMCSVSASLATFAFNKYFAENLEIRDDYSVAAADKDKWNRLTDTYYDALDKGALFDSRVFNIPKEEVNNCLVWRQIDAVRNSIQALAQAHFSHKRIQNKNRDTLLEMLETERGIAWSSYPLYLQRGSCCVKEQYELDVDNEKVLRTRWVVDEEIPLFTKDTDYVNSKVMFV